MSQIEDLQTRISRALDRIGQTVDKAGASSASAEEVEALKARLSEAETALATAQEAAEAARTKAEAEMAAAVEAARAEAAAKLDKAVEAALAEAAPGPEEDFGEPEAPAEAEPAADPAELVSLREALEDEQMANAQLQERLRALKARSSGGVSPETVAKLDSELQRLRKANEGLLSSSAALREANAQGLADAGLIDAAMVAELEALRAARASEAAEVEAVMGTLEPMLAEAVRTQGEAG